VPLKRNYEACNQSKSLNTLPDNREKIINSSDKNHVFHALISSLAALSSLLPGLACMNETDTPANRTATGS
jgi:hypothetical protein